MLSFTDQFLAARRVSVPLIGIECTDPGATMKTLLNECSDVPKPVAVLSWNSVDGMFGYNAAGEKIASMLNDNPDIAAPITFLSSIADEKVVPPYTIIGMLAAADWLEQPVVRQAIWNLRDKFKRNGRTLVLLSEVLLLPTSLKNDIVILEEPMPDEAQLAELTQRLDRQASSCNCSNDKSCKKCGGMGLKMKRPLCDEPIVGRIVEAVKGLPYFGAEQVVSMALRTEPVKGQKSGCIDLEHCWSMKRKQIEQTKGLSIHRGGETFADLGGLDQIKQYLSRIMTGRKPPKLIVWLDEIEKTGLANRQDTSGVNQDQEGTLLSWMEDYDVFGVMLLGVPGCLADDTYVSYLRGSRKGGARRLPIAEFCEKFNGQKVGHGHAGAWQLGIDTFLHSFDEASGKLTYNKVRSVWYSGEKRCLRIETADGGDVTLTHDHPVLMADGTFQPAGEVVVGDELLLQGDLLPHAIKVGPKTRQPREEIYGVTFHPYRMPKRVTDPKSGVIYEYHRQRRARLVVEAHLNNLSLMEFVEILGTDQERSESLQFLSPDFDVHHKNENTIDDSYENLEVLPHAGHTSLHAPIDQLNVEHTRTTIVIRIEDAGMRRTYDIEMESPLNNFSVNNGIIVHNCGKSAICKAVGAEFDRVVIRIDLGAMQGSLVGQSQNYIRSALKVVQAIGGSDTLWLATSNSISGLSSAMRSRFTDCFFFDLPPLEERRPIWDVWLKKLELQDEQYVDDEGWVARNIKKCCDKAFRMSIPISEAATFITPVGLTDREEIRNLRAGADNRFLSASHPGVYKIPKNVEPERALSL